MLLESSPVTEKWFGIGPMFRAPSLVPWAVCKAQLFYSSIKALVFLRYSYRTPCIIIQEQVLLLTFPACRLAESLGQEDAGDYSLEDSSDSQRLKHKGVGFLPRICGSGHPNQKILWRRGLLALLCSSTRLAAIESMRPKCGRQYDVFC